MKFFNKAQISLEFISIFAIGLTITLILGGLFYSVSTSEKSKLDTNQINRIGNDIIRFSEEIYFRGSGNKIQYKANFPDGIEYMHIKQYNTTSYNYSELVFGVYDGDRLSNITFNPSESYITINCSNTCNYNATENIGSYNSSDFGLGPKTLAIKSIGDQVLIEFVR